MTEKNVVGMSNKGDEFSAHKFGEDSEEGGVPANNYHVSSPAKVRSVTGAVSTMDPIAQWRYFSEALQQRRNEKQQPQAAPEASRPPAQKQVPQRQKDKQYQHNYEHDAVQLSEASDPLYLSFQKYLSQVNYAIDDEDQKMYSPPEEEHPACPDGNLRVADVMTKRVICVIESTPIEEFASICNRRDITGVPVVHYTTRRLLGEVAISDIVEHMFNQKVLSTFQAHGEVLEQQSLGILDEPVRDFMNTNLVTVTPESSVQRACQLMAENNLRRIIVVKGDLVKGIFTARDAVKVLAGIESIKRPEAIQETAQDTPTEKP